MKKFMIMMVAILGTMFTNANAMSYEQARDQALFLTDKMAYELNLTDAQYEAAYEINLDYLMGVNTVDDVYADYWVRRNADFRYILLDWQFSAFCAASYFYRPIWWEAGFWHFGIYARYPHRDYFYFGRPHFYHTYHGGHSWHMNGGRSWYHGRTFATRNHGNFSGMRDGWNRGDYRGGRQNIGGTRGNTGNVGGTRGTSGQRQGNFGGSRRSGVSESNRSTSGTRGNADARSHENVGSQQRQGGSSSSGNYGGRRIGGSRSESGFSSSHDNLSGSRESSTRTTVTRPSSSTTRIGGSNGSSSSYSRGGSSSSSSFSRGGSSSSSSFSRGGSSSSSSFSHGGGSSSHGGGHFSGRR